MWYFVVGFIAYHTLHVFSYGSLPHTVQKLRMLKFRPSSCTRLTRVTNQELRNISLKWPLTFFYFVLFLLAQARGEQLQGQWQRKCQCRIQGFPSEQLPWKAQWCKFKKKIKIKATRAHCWFAPCDITSPSFDHCVCSNIAAHTFLVYACLHLAVIMSFWIVLCPIMYLNRL